MELESVIPTEMELAHSSSSPSTTRSSTPVMSNCERLQIANSEIRKFSILYANVSHAIEAAAPFAQDDDSDLADMYARQHYLDQRRHKAVSDHSSLPRCDTPGCRIHSTPVNSPTKLNFNEYPELTKSGAKRKESGDDGFISPTSKQTDIWKSGKNIIVSYNYKFKNGTPAYLWPSIPRAWGNKHDKESLRAYFQEVFSKPTPKCLWAAMAEMTPNTLFILFHPENGLRNMAEQINTEVTHWFRDLYWQKANIVATDYFLGNHVIDVAIRTNQVKAVKRYQANGSH
ncbi:PI-PLC X domain-containing protein 1 [Trichonephila inaurata madagascariensis]|uniref:PI-PLC X domain-containing protein 1 n=1 Tax=Trichonephila inaurata madagascariensis TaxID=2747483 RepID=A0A8X7BSF9_9ARAC|nr:PI-PLC X domain-containing protein 1 [Trichonephila inaurata madagascariensis]